MIEKLIIPLDYIILAIGCLIVIYCFWRGVTASILGLLTWLGSIIITIYFYTDLSDFLNSQLLNINNCKVLVVYMIKLEWLILYVFISVDIYILIIQRTPGNLWSRLMCLFFWSATLGISINIWGSLGISKMITKRAMGTKNC